MNTPSNDKMKTTLVWSKISTETPGQGERCLLFRNKHVFDAVFESTSEGDYWMIGDVGAYRVKLDDIFSTWPIGPEGV